MSVAIAEALNAAVVRHLRPHLFARARVVTIDQRLTTRQASWRSGLQSLSPRPNQPPHATRPFTTSPWLAKKGGKAAREEKQSTSKAKSAANDDPFDFSALEEDIATVIERLKTDVSKLRAGGRFNPEVIENLRVQPVKNDNQTVKLSDLAQVIPYARNVQILVGEKDHLKPVSSAIQSSSLSLTPTPDPTGANPLLLVVKIPPPTAETRQAAVNEAIKAGEKASMSVRDARGKQQKKLRAMQLSKAALPDDLKKAGTMMEKVVEKGAKEVNKVADNVKKMLTSV